MNAFTIPKKSIFTSPAELKRQRESEAGKKAGRVRYENSRGNAYMSRAVQKRSG